MFKIIVDSLKTGIITEPRPFDVRPPFGFPVIDFPRCTLCEECARACPTGAIHTAEAGPGQRTLSLSYASCIQCRACVDACPEKAVSAGRDVEDAHHAVERAGEDPTSVGAELARFDRLRVPVEAAQQLRGPCIEEAQARRFSAEEERLTVG